MADHGQPLDCTSVVKTVPVVQCSKFHYTMGAQQQVMGLARLGNKIYWLRR